MGLGLIFWIGPWVALMGLTWILSDLARWSHGVRKSDFFGPVLIFAYQCNGTCRNIWEFVTNTLPSHLHPKNWSNRYSDGSKSFPPYSHFPAFILTLLSYFTHPHPLTSPLGQMCLLSLFRPPITRHSCQLRIKAFDDLLQRLGATTTSAYYCYRPPCFCLL